MKDTVWLTCDECKEIFEVKYGIAVSMWECQEEAGDPILCHVCMPQDPYEEEL